LEREKEGDKGERERSTGGGFNRREDQMAGGERMDSRPIS
jgi:hypothetical protein